MGSPAPKDRDRPGKVAHAGHPSVTFDAVAGPISKALVTAAPPDTLPVAEGGNARSRPPFTAMTHTPSHDSVARGGPDGAETVRQAPRPFRGAAAAALLVLVCAAFFVSSTTDPAFGQPERRRPRTGAQTRLDHEHRSWTEILDQYVVDGAVDYRGLGDRGQPAFDAYLDTLRAASSAESGWTREERLAFWVNAYNAFTIRLILDHHPLPSIRAIGFLPLAAFRTRFIPLGTDQRMISLNMIENDILRRRFQDPRIHFAIVCASKSCPALLSEAYRATIIDQQLDMAARAFLADPSKNRWDSVAGTLYLSSIFKWFRGDFERAAGTVPIFVGRYMHLPDVVASGSRSVRTVFLPYDWSLNEQ